MSKFIPLAAAIEAMGEQSILGPDAYEKAERSLERRRLPVIPASFTQNFLELAKKSRQKLVLQADGLSMIEMNDNAQKRDKKLLYDISQYFKKDFANKPLRRGWRLMSTDILLGSTGKTMPAQMELVAQELERQLGDSENFAQYQGPIAKFRGMRQRIEDLMGDAKWGEDIMDNPRWGAASKLIENSALARVALPRPCEITNLMDLDYAKNGVRLFERFFTRTATRYSNNYSSGSSLVHVGYFGPLGAFLDDHKPAFFHDELGLSLSLMSTTRT